MNVMSVWAPSDRVDMVTPMATPAQTTTANESPFKQFMRQWGWILAAFLVAADAALLVILYLAAGPDEAKCVAAWSAIVAAIFLFLKEMFAAIARSPHRDTDAWEDNAAICSLFAVVFGAPAVATTIVAILH